MWTKVAGAGEYGVGMIFFPRDKNQHRLAKILQNIAHTFSCL